MKIAILVLFSILLREGESVAYEAVCAKTTECEANKNYECRSPSPDCAKGYCLCPDNAVDHTADGCVLEYKSNGEACDHKAGKMCLAVAGLQCQSSSGKCGCIDGTWDTDKKICFDAASVKAVASPAVDCGSAAFNCRAQSGKVTQCTDDAGSKCACATDYKFKDGGCVSISNYNGDCAANADCFSSYRLFTNGVGASDVNTNFVCKSTKCACNDANPTFVSTLTSTGFCKENNGTKAADAECASSNDCSGTMLCAKCPGDTTASKCYKDFTSGASGLVMSVMVVTVLSSLVAMLHF